MNFKNCRLLRHVYQIIIIVSHILRRTLVKAYSLANRLLSDLHLGGFEGFSEAYPDLCYNSASNRLSTVEPEPAATGRRTPAYDQVR